MALAAAAEVDDALRDACERAAGHVGREDSRCLAAGCSVRELDRRWDRRLQASGLAGDRAARARLIACQAMAESVAGPDDERFLGPVREMNLRGSSVRGQLDRRYDLRLHFRGAVKAAVVSAVKALRPAVAELLTDDALVCELACLITDPGAARQRLHADTTFDDRGFLLSAFIALQDVDSDMGGTIVVPGTANRAGHESMKAVIWIGRGVASGACCASGACALRDRRVAHC